MRGLDQALGWESPDSQKAMPAANDRDGQEGKDAEATELTEQGVRLAVLNPEVGQLTSLGNSPPTLRSWHPNRASNPSSAWSDCRAAAVLRLSSFPHTSGHSPVREAVSSMALLLPLPFASAQD